MRCLASLPVACLALAAAAPAQGRAVVPPIAATLPGNAAVSLPLRWSHGTLQVLIAPPLLPPSLIGQQIRGVRLRRPAFLGEPPYAGVQRTLTVRAGFTVAVPTQVTPFLAANRPAGVQVVAGPAVQVVPATTPANGAQPLGAEFLVVPFAVPLPIVAGQLFLEFEAGDAPLNVADAWVDAVWMHDGVDHGYVVPIGDAGCTLGGPLQLLWRNTDGPLRGSTARFRLFGAAPGAGAFAAVGINPESQAPGGQFFGFGASLGSIDPGLAGCHQWTPIDLLLLGQADALGNYDVSFEITASLTTAGMRVGVQAGYLDPARGGLGLSISNGQVLQLDTARVDNRCVSVFYPGAATTSPWGPQLGLMPVVVLDL